MTGDVSQAATSARVYIIMYGGKSGEECSGKIWLDGGKFSRGRTDIFEQEVATVLSPLSRIEIGHDNSGAGPGWYLDRVSCCFYSMFTLRKPRSAAVLLVHCRMRNDQRK